MDHSYFAPIFKIQIVKKIKAAIGFFCAQWKLFWFLRA